MKAITLTQPWATLVAVGAKRIETRSWGTNYRGPLAIHAAKGLRPVQGLTGLTTLCFDEPFASVLEGAGYWVGRLNEPQLPLGVVVATCRLADCIQMGSTDRQFNAIVDRYGADFEDHFGDFNAGRYAWILADVVKLPEPTPARGSLGLWEWDAPKGTPYPAPLAGAR